MESHHGDRRAVRVLVGFLGLVRAGSPEPQPVCRSPDEQPGLWLQLPFDLVSIAQLDVHDLRAGAVARLAVDPARPAPAFESGEIRPRTDLRGSGIRAHRAGSED